MKIRDFFADFTNNFKIFLSYLDEEQVDIYNEFSLQHELGIFLRGFCVDAKNYKIEFERNISFLGITYTNIDLNFSKLIEAGLASSGLKREIDICVYKGIPFTKEFEGYAIELKYPSVKQNLDLKTGEVKKTTNGAFPDQMYFFAKDVKFMETLVNKRNPFFEPIFKHTFCIALVDTFNVEKNKEFFGGNGIKSDGIYKYFHDSKNNHLNGIIRKPRKDKEKLKALYLLGDYEIIWHSWVNKEGIEKGKYYILEVDAL